MNETLVVLGPNTVTNVTKPDTAEHLAVSSVASSVTTINMAAQGAQGVPGTGAAMTLQAAQSIIAYKVITSDSAGHAIYADAGNVNHIGKVIGLANNAASIGNSVDVIQSQIVSNSGWTWTPNQNLFLGLNGDITPSQVGLICVHLGYAISATEVLLNISSGILRS